jgi:hypothetical protein
MHTLAKIGSRFIAALVAGAAFTCTAYAQTVAIVSDLKGEARIAGSPAKVMSELTKDSAIELGRDGRASVMFLASGKEFSVRGPGAFQIEGEGLKASVGAAPVARQTAWRVSNDVVVKVAETAPASIRMRSIAPRVELLSPTRGKLSNLKPSFAWTAGSADTTVQFELLEGDTGRDVVIAARAQGDKFLLPANVSLRAGKTYRWSVKRSDNPDSAAEATFATLSDADLLRVTRQRPRDNAAISDWVMYGLTLHDMGAYADAKVVWERLAKVRPEFVELAKQ